jgi:hypothetical protein
MKNSMSLEQYKLSGIYRIRNLTNDKIYIGSAFRFYDRFRVHLSRLNNNKHDNDHLQKSYNKYGKNNFIFEIIELSTQENIYDLEKKYLDIYWDNGINCYNINTETIPEKSLFKYNEERKKVFQLISPENILFNFRGYSEAAKKIGTSINAVFYVIKGKYKTCKGWRLPENIDYDIKHSRSPGKEYNVKFLSPQGVIYGPIFNMKEFAKLHNVNPSIFFNIMSGRTRYCNGWSLYDNNMDQPESKNSKDYNVKIISPSGIIFDSIKNLNKFCKEYNLSPSSMRNLINGKTKKLEYKGWKLIKK